MTNTKNTSPGRVFRVRRLPRPAPHDKHVKCAHWGTFYVLVIILTPSAYASLLAPANTNTKNASCNAFFVFVASTTTPSTAEHQEHALVGVFSVFGGFLTPTLVFNVILTSPLTPNNQNVPIGAHFG